MANENEFLINTHGPLQPINGNVDPNGGFVTLKDGETGRTVGGAFTGAGVPANLQGAGAQPFTQGFTDSLEKNSDRSDMSRAGRAIQALEDDDLERFDDLNNSLTHGFIVGSGARR